MTSSDMHSLVPNPGDLLSRPVEDRGVLLLQLLKEYDNPSRTVCHSNFFNRADDYRNPPRYGSRQPDVDSSLMEAWSWAESQILLVKKPSSGGPTWVFVGDKGKQLLQQNALFERLEALGLDHVKHGLVNGFFSSAECGPVSEWVRIKAGDAMVAPKKRTDSREVSTLIAENRIDELRNLSSPDFDFQKLIRLCEELNSSYGNGNYYATAMLTRGMLDHVPPLFGHKTFTEVANNYSGDGRSFREHMQHLEGSARKVSDGHLHSPIRKSESLPQPQQVWCGQELDALLGEIVRIKK